MKNYVLQYDSYERERLNFRESIMTLGNTYMGIRGVEDELPEGSLPGLYIAGMFDQSECLVSEIVNFPNFITLYAEVEGQKLSPDTVQVLGYSRSLNMKDGTVERKTVYKAGLEKTFTLESTRFLSFYDKNCGAVRVKISSCNFSGSMKIISEYDASLPSREGSYLYDEQVRHCNTLAINDQYDEDFYSRIQMRDRGYLVDIGTHVACEGAEIKKRSRRIYGEKVREAMEFHLEKGREVSFYKYFAVTDSRAVTEESLKEICLSKLQRMKYNGFEKELDRSVSILSSRWDQADVKIDGDDENDLALRFNIFNLLALGSEDTSRFAIGAKGLSTEHYGGHYFWDTEAYLLSFYLNTAPAVARNLLKFRCNTLEKAKQRARSMGFEGCLWAWQSTDEGEEGIRNTVKENGVVIRRHILDQYHIVSDVAFACFKYLYRTNDEYSFRTDLNRLVLEGMRFWRSFLLKTNKKEADKYEIRNVMGPDEYHKTVSNNYYTNYLTKLVFGAFFEYYENCDEKQRYDLQEINAITPGELSELKEIGERIYLPEIKDDVIEQFEGYFKLRDSVVEKYSDRGLPVYPHAEVGRGLPDIERQDALQEDANRTQLIKQADALQAICQNPSGFSKKVIRSTFDYYLKRSLHFSSLSPGVYSYGAALAGRLDDAYRMFGLSVNMDLKDVKDETETGLHTACHGGAYQSVVEGFAGVRAEKDYLEIDPLLPAHWESLEFSLVYRGMGLRLAVRHDRVNIQLLNKGTVNICFKGEVREYCSWNNPSGIELS